MIVLIDNYDISPVETISLYLWKSRDILLNTQNTRLFLLLAPDFDLLCNIHNLGSELKGLGNV